MSHVVVEAKGPRVTVRHERVGWGGGVVKLAFGETVVGATPLGLLVQKVTPFVSRIRRAARVGR